MALGILAVLSTLVAELARSTRIACRQAVALAEPGTFSGLGVVKMVEEADVDQSFGESSTIKKEQDVRLPSLKLHTFTGVRTEYEERGREIRAMELLYSIPPKQMSMLVYLALESGPGKPRDLLSHLDIEVVATDQGYHDMMEFSIPSLCVKTM